MGSPRSRLARLASGYGACEASGRPGTVASASPRCGARSRCIRGETHAFSSLFVVISQDFLGYLLDFVGFPWIS